MTAAVMATAANMAQSTESAQAQQLPPQNCTNFSVCSIYLLKAELTICLEGEGSSVIPSSSMYSSFWYQNTQFYCSHITAF